MSSANNHKRHTLEEEFQRRLFDAEAKPAPDLWARIDHDLTVQENRNYKKRVLFYRQLAAACFVLFALTGTLLAYYYNDNLNEGAPQQGIASSPEAAIPESITPEEAMKAYMEQQAATSTMAQAATEEVEEPATAVASTNRQKTASGLTESAVVAAAQGSGDYYNAASGYGPYLNYGSGAVAGRNRGFVSSGLPSTANFGAGETGTTPSSRYTQIITWESVTITFGNGNTAGQQPLQQNQAFAAKPRSFAEMNDAYQAARQQQTTKPAEVLGGTLAMEKTQKESANTKRDSRWSLNLAYAPRVFEQNIGLPDPLSSGNTGNNTFRIAAGPSINASEDSYQNITAAREEFEDSAQPAFSYAMEVKAGFKLKEKLKLLTGIGYSESTAKSKSNFIVRQFWTKPRSNESYELNPSTFFLSSLNNGFTSDSVSVARTSESFATEYKYRHLTVPVGLQYEHDVAKDWFVYAAAGVAANFLLESSVTTSNHEVQPVSFSANDQESPFRNVQLSSNASVGVGKRVSPNLTLALGPEVRNYFSTLLADPEKASAPQGKPYAIGLNMSLNYQLNNSRK
ncbi:outer membrane beta-barrel protein [uncultured Pontibacter sp.]|uniref:outer membrane beta-barrel protein n=1 Tax=uncultured Pontibacter sp. TaxID=453356 RepID=UPI00262FC31D|nr:outer membrane beta-barrel protein [uncultured Pontibacter sp.]